MKIVSNPDKSLIPKWQIEVGDWNTDQKNIAAEALLQLEKGYQCLVAINDTSNLAAICTYQIQSTSDALKNMGVHVLMKNDPGGIEDIYKKYDFKIDENRSQINNDVIQQLYKYSIFTPDIIKKLPRRTIRIESLAGIGVGGSGMILRLLISKYKLIYLTMYNAKQSMSFYQHFEFVKLANTNCMYLLT